VSREYSSCVVSVGRSSRRRLVLDAAFRMAEDGSRQGELPFASSFHREMRSSVLESVPIFGIFIFQCYLCTAFVPIVHRQRGSVVQMAKSVYERVLEKPQFPPAWPFTDFDFTRTDESDDTIFYNSPRL
jgi:hypothetical protein